MVNVVCRHVEFIGGQRFIFDADVELNNLCLSLVNNGKIESYKIGWWDHSEYECRRDHELTLKQFELTGSIMNNLSDIQMNISRATRRSETSNIVAEELEDAAKNLVECFVNLNKLRNP